MILEKLSEIEKEITLNTESLDRYSRGLKNKFKDELAFIERYIHKIESNPNNPIRSFH